MACVSLAAASLRACGPCLRGSLGARWLCPSDQGNALPSALPHHPFVFPSPRPLPRISHGQAGVNIMIIGACDSDKVSPLKAVELAWTGFDLAFALWDPTTATSLVAYNVSSNHVVRVDALTGVASDVSDVVAPLPGLVGTQSAALDHEGHTLYVVVVDPTKTPSRYETVIADVKTGNITAVVPTQGNMDFDYLFVL